MDALRSEFSLSSDYLQDSTDAYVLAKNGYVLGAEIGSGSYSTVTKATKDNLEYACKIVNMAKTSWEYRTKFLPREINIMARLRHPNITRVFEIICEAKRVFIIMELATAGDLLSMVQNAGRLDEKTAHRIFVQLASAVAYLHRRNIAHRDLKCDNVLLSGQLVVKLADFSFSRYCNDPVERRKSVHSESYCGSEAYAPPEVLQGVPYYPMQADMWSMGVILYVMTTVALPFPDGNILQQVRLQMNRAIHFPLYVDCTPEYRSLVRHLLEPVTTLRATMRVVAKHPWLFAFPDPTKTRTLKVQPRATIPDLNSPAPVRDWQPPQRSASSVTVDVRGVPLPALDRKAATERLPDQTVVGRTNDQTFGQVPHFPTDMPENIEGCCFEESAVCHVQSGQQESGEVLFGETTSTSISSDDIDPSTEEDTSSPREHTSVESKLKPHRRNGQQNKGKVRTFFDSISTVCPHDETPNRRTQGGLNRQVPRFSESFTYLVHLAERAQDQLARQQQPLYPACYPTEADDDMGLCLHPLGAYGGDPYIEAPPYPDGKFTNIWSVTEVDQGIMAPNSGYALPGCAAYVLWSPSSPTSSRFDRGY